MDGAFEIENLVNLQEIRKMTFGEIEGCFGSPPF
jgi:hypothetical protein